MFENVSKENKLKFSFIVRFLYIPQFYKNFILSIMNVNLKEFLIPNILHYIPYLLLPLLIGSNLKSLQNFYKNGKIPNKTVYFYFVCFSIFIGLSIILLIVLASLAYKKVQKMTNLKKTNLVEEEMNDIENNKKETKIQN